MVCSGIEPLCGEEIFSSPTPSTSAQQPIQPDVEQVTFLFFFPQSYNNQGVAWPPTLSGAGVKHAHSFNSSSP